MTETNATLDAPRSRLCDFLRDRKGEIVVDWTRRMRALSPARELSDSAIVDQLPQLLMRIADVVESAQAGESASLGDLPSQHAVDRLGRGFDLDQIVTEYGLLRRSVLDLWGLQAGPTIALGELRAFDLALDESLRQAAVRYAQAREKLLHTLDRIAESALGPGDLDTFLEDLLRAVLNTTESADTAVVLLREGDTLRVRAAVGLEATVNERFSLTPPAGFAAHVAAARQPILIHDAATDPRVISRAIRAKGVRTLYGVPLMRGDKVVGVAHIGSLKAAEFSEEDKLLFRTMASRATSVVMKAQILADLRRAETAQRFLSEASKQFAQSLDYEATLGKIAHLAVPTIADWCVVDLVQNGAVRRVSVAHTDPRKEDLAYELEKRYPTDVTALTGIAHVLRTRRSELHSEITDSQLSALARDPEHLRILRELGLRAYIIVPIVARERAVGTIALVSAESKRRYSEDDLRIAEDLAARAASAIENARLYAEAQDAVRMRERILAVVSHDLRNQLGVISMGAHLLGMSAGTLKNTDAIGRPVETIQRTASTMQHLVGDLLDMASIQAGQLSIEPEPVALKPLIIETCENHEAIAQAKGVRLRTSVPFDDVEILCDRRRILQVLENLVGNAIKFSEAGDAVTLHGEVQERTVLVAVTDTGPGIPSDARQSIFEPYRTMDGQARSGTGLGLYITRGIIERHGGQIWVKSEVGAGSTFFFTLPRVM
jgi:signal transduction histidine kinase